MSEYVTARASMLYGSGEAGARAVRNAEKIDGSMSHAELTWLSGNASRRQRIVEIGCWAGRSTTAIAQSTSGTVRAVDSWEHREDLLDTFRRNLAPEIAAGKLVLMHTTSLDAAAFLEQSGERFDMIFIDADHGYDAVKADIAAWGQLLLPGGLLCGHDYDPLEPGVILAVEELLRGQFRLCDTIWHVRKKAS